MLHSALPKGCCLPLILLAGLPWTGGAAQTGAEAQTISFPLITGFQSVGGSVTFSATASSGLPVTFSTTSAGVCAVSGNTASFSGVGTCTVTATQGGNGSYAAVTVSQSFAVAARGLSFYDIKTLAGDGVQGYSGDSGPATSAAIADPGGVAVDGSGNVYIADTYNSRIRKVTPGGTISTIAGGYFRGFTGDGGPAANAALDNPTGVAVDGSGNLYIADSGNNRIRMVNAVTGNISTIAGCAFQGYNGDGGPATSAGLSNPVNVAVDSSGNVYIADYYNNRIRMVNAVTGNISTIAGNGTFGSSGDGGPATSAEVAYPAGVAVDGSGNVYIGDSWSRRIRMVNAATGNISTIAGNGNAGFGGDGGPATSAEMNGVLNLAVDSSGNVYITDTGNDRIRMVNAATGQISTIAGNGFGGFGGDGGSATSTELSLYGENYPGGLAVNGSGNVYIADVDNSRIRVLLPVILQSLAVTPASATIAPGGTQPFGATATYSDGTTPVITSVTWSSATTAAATINAAGLASGVAPGTTQITASSNGVISPAAMLTVALGQTPQTITFAPPATAAVAGPLVVTATASSGLPVNLSSVTPSVCALSSTTSPATANFLEVGTCMILASQPGDGVTYAAAQTITRTITVGIGLQTIYFQPVTGFQTVGGTVTLGAAASSGLPVTLSTNSAGVCTITGNMASLIGAGTCTVTATQAGNANYTSAKTAQSFTVAATQLSFYDIKTFAGNGVFGSGGDGGPATSAELNYPSGIAVDGSGNVYIADLSNNRIRKVTLDGTISTIAGNGIYGFSGDGGPATNAELADPIGLALDTSGNLYIADADNQRIRMVSAATGNISTIAGNGTEGFSGDGGAATSAQLSFPTGVAVDSGGNVYIADSYNNRIRMVSAFTGNIGTVAGSDATGFSGDGGPAISAQLNEPIGVAVDGSGNIYIADTYNERIRMVSAATGNISTIAGNGNYGFSGDGVFATSTALSDPFGVAVDSGGNVYIADTYDHRIRVVTPGGIISTIAGTGTPSFGGDGGPATNANLYDPRGSAVDGRGNVYIADTFNRRVRELLPVALQSIAVTPASGTIIPGGTEQFAATAIYSDGSTQIATSTVTWNSGTPSTATINATGLASGVALGTTNITASSNGVTSPAALLTVIAATPQTITFTPPSTAAVSAPLVLTATASSGLTVNLSSATPSICTLSGATSPATANFMAVGTCTILASQPGDSVTYAPAPTVTATITVGIGTQIISFPPITGFQSVGGTVTFSAATNAGLPVTFSSTTAGVCTLNGNTASLIGAGTCKISAAAPANANYTAAQTAQSFTVAPRGLSFYDIKTSAGNGTPTYSGDGGAATSESLNSATGVAIDGNGNVYVADTSNQRIRKVTPSGVISTIAGNGTAGFSGDGGPATSAELNGPSGVAVDGSGNVYIADSENYRIRMLNATTGNISTIAGNGNYGFSGDGGPATSAQLANAYGVAVDSAGDVYIADNQNNRIRLVNAATGSISTIAGNGSFGFSGDGGPATSAALNSPLGVAVDASGNVYIADSSNERIRMVSAATKTINTIAGNGDYGFSGDGGPATSAALAAPEGVAVDSSGNVYIADTYNNRIRLVTPGGIIGTIAGNGTGGFGGDSGPATGAKLHEPIGVAVDGSGNVYVADYDNSRIRELLPVALQSIAVTPASATVIPGGTQQFAATGTYSDGSTQAVTSTVTWNSGTTATATINAAGLASGVAVGATNITASLNGSTSPAAVLTVGASTAQTITFTPPSLASVASPVVLTATASSGLTVNLSSLTPSVCTLSSATSPATANFLTVGTCMILASQPGDGVKYAPAPTVTGTITVGPKGPTISFPPITGFQSVGGTVTFSATASSGLPVTFSTTSTGVCVVNGNTASLIGAGTCTVTATVGNGNNAPASVSQSFTVAARGLSFYDIKTIAGNGTWGFSGDGGPATSAELAYPGGVAMDTSGNVYIVDSENTRVRMVSAATGKISTIAGNGNYGFSGDGGPATSAEMAFPYGVAVDTSGNVYIVDSENNRIRMVSAATGKISTIAGNGNYGFSGDGGLATNAELASPNAVAVDSSGNFYIADSGNNRIRMVSAATGNISTVAGNGTASFSGDGGPATSAQLYNPSGVAVDASGNLYIADFENNRIRMVNAATRNISTIAGNGTASFSGDGGPATGAALSYPINLAVDGSGNIYIADTYNQRIRLVSAATGNISTVAGDGNASFSGDGGPATRAELRDPSNVAVDPSGKVIIADTYNQAIRELLPVVLQSIAVTPASATIIPGGTLQFAATATYTDSSTSNVTSAATWNSGSPATATINATGLATGVASGTTNITASLNGVTSPAAVLTVALTTPNSSAAYLGSNTSKQGTWTGTFGSDGNVIANETPAAPSYASVNLTGDYTYTWYANTSDQRALQTSSGATTRVAAQYFSTTSFNINVDLTDGNSHQVALYLLDFDNASRAEIITIKDAATNTVLDTENYSNFQSGVWAVWNIKGNVVIQVTTTGGPNATVSGIFFGPATAKSAAKYVASDITTQGSWTGTFGSDGNVIAGETPAAPSYASVALTGDYTYTWYANTSDQRALQTSSGATTRVASQYFSTSGFNIDINLTDGNTHQIALYLLDFDNASRAESITIRDPLTNAVLDAENYSNFQSGVWAVWNITGHVVIQVTTTGGPNATVSGIFFGPATAKSSATYVTTNTSIQGSWTGTFGADGNLMADETPAAPTYASVGLTGDYTYTWYANTTDLRALQTSSGATTRVAAQYFSPSSFNINVNLTDGNTHQVALYLLDFDNASRAESITIKDALTSAVLDTENYSNFQNGVWAVWNITGSVVIQVTTTGGPNATVSGIFFGPTLPKSSAAYIATDTATHGTWTGKFGGDGNVIANQPAAAPSYANVGLTGDFTYTWSANTSDLRALQASSGGTTRVATQYYCPTSFNINVNLTDGNMHQIALYLLDYDNAGRAESITIKDALTNAVLDTESYSNFQTGVWAVWNITGSVVIQVTATGGPNATLSGIFFGPTTSATYVATNTTTRGTWTGTFGADGNVIADQTPAAPSYAAIGLTGDYSYTWSADTSDTRALQTSSGAATRIASQYYSPGSFNINVDLTDGKTHQVALYLLDFDNASRAETITVKDALTNSVLDTESYANFQNGVWAVWNIQGSVVIQVATTSGPNATISGIFFGPPATMSSAANVQKR